MTTATAPQTTTTETPKRLRLVRQFVPTFTAPEPRKPRLVREFVPGCYGDPRIEDAIKSLPAGTYTTTTLLDAARDVVAEKEQRAYNAGYLNGVRRAVRRTMTEWAYLHMVPMILRATAGEYNKTK